MTDNKTKFIDAGGEDLFKKATNNNILLDEQIEAIMQLFVSKADVVHVAKTINNSEIAKNNYNLLVSSFIEAKITVKELKFLS